MNETLESRLRGEGYRNMKSEGERRIAYFLEDNSIKYRYEPALLINSDEKPRIWYPDFYLPEFSAYIEYFGLVGRENYDGGVKRKEAVYSHEGLEVISVYPWTFTGNWQEYIMKELEHITIRRYQNLMEKPYWVNHHNNNVPKHNRYHHRMANHY